MPTITLYSYFRSSAAYRVRIALHLKQLEYETRPVNLAADAGGQHQAAYLAINPQGLVPTLLDGDVVLNQSLAIIEYLEEAYPNPPLLPQTPEARALVRSLANTVACDIHPLNNLRVLDYLKRTWRGDENAKLTWYRHWINAGFRAIEELLQKRANGDAFCYGGSPTLADTCLIPQIYNALRYECDLSYCPVIQNIYAHCLTLDAFQRAAPERQPDAK